MAYGEIGTVIDTLEFDTASCEWPSVVRVFGNIYAIAYRNVADEGWIATVEISSNGQIADAVIDTFRFESQNCDKPHLIQVAANVFAVAYPGFTDQGWIKSIGIANDGTITSPSLDTLMFDNVTCRRPSICEITDNMFVVAYTDSNEDPKIVTIPIANDGTIPAAVTDTWVVFAGFAYELTIIKIATAKFGIFYRAQDNNFWIRTISIDGAGSITKTEVDSASYTHTSWTDPFALTVNGDKYAVASTDGDEDGRILSTDISDAGAIADAYIDELEFDDFYCRTPHICEVGANVFAIAHEGGSDFGWIRTVTILTDGLIGDPCIDSLAFDILMCKEPFVFHVTANIFAVAYSGVDADGFIKTFPIESPGYEAPQQEMMMGIGP